MVVGDEGHLRPSRRIQASRVVCAGRAAAGGVRGRSDLSRHRRLARRRGQVVHERVPEAEVAHGARGGAAADLRYAPVSEPDHQQHLTATVESTWMSLVPRRERGAVGVAHALPQAPAPRPVLRSSPRPPLHDVRLGPGGPYWQSQQTNLE